MFRGVHAFPVTPFRADGSIDVEGVAFNADWLAEFDFASIVTPSGTGEFFTLSPDECLSVLTASVSAVKGRCLVVAGVGHGPTTGAAMARAAVESGADALLILPPYYPDPDPTGLVDYYLEVGSATELPFMIYARGSAQITTNQILDLARATPQFVAFKEGRNDVRRFQRMRIQVDRELGSGRLAWLCGAGDDLVAPFFAAGADGFTSSLACFWPEASIDLLRAARDGDSARTSQLQRDVVSPFYDLRERGQGLEVSVMKSAMTSLNLPAGDVRAPLAKVLPEMEERIANLVRQLQVPDRGVRARGQSMSIPRVVTVRRKRWS